MYTFIKVSAFHKDETHVEGYDYVPAGELIKRVADTALGRFYIDADGNAVYESRFRREV